MVNKKGFIRTLEAVIAIILILGFIFYITPKTIGIEEKVPEDVANAKEFILNQILLNKEYSTCVFNANTNAVGSKEKHGNCEDALTCTDEYKKKILKLFEYIPYGYDFACEICSSSGCGVVTYPPDKSIYTNSIFVYKAGRTYNIMRIYIWKK